MRRYLEILEALGNFPGSVQVRSFDPETREVGTGGDASVIATYSTTPKLNWDPMDYNMNSNGTLLKVHPGSPVTHGIKV